MVWEETRRRAGGMREGEEEGRERGEVWREKHANG